jgi:hypothetical protein
LVPVRGAGFWAGAALPGLAACALALRLAGVAALSASAAGPAAGLDGGAGLGRCRARGGLGDALRGAVLVLALDAD